MYYLVNVDHNSMAAHLTGSDRAGFLKVLYIHCSGWEGAEGTNREGGDRDTDW
jgi:hypothetical protein